MKLGASWGSRVAVAAMLFGVATGSAACVSETDEPSATSSDALVNAGGPYPVVLVHGFFGFDTFAGLEAVRYFNGVQDYLAARGEHVYTPAIDPFNDSQHRAERLLEHITRIQRETGASKVNLIGHSQGGLDARVVAHDRPDLVASVTTIGTPHFGTPIADILAAPFPGDLLVRPVVDFFVKVTLKPLWKEISSETSFSRQVAQLSSWGMRRFNEEITDAPGIPYFSIAGRSSDRLATRECQSADAPDFITRYARQGDRLDPLLTSPEFIVHEGGLANDGFVRVRDAKWGKFLGCIPADHFDEVGHLFDDTTPDGRHWNHVELYDGLVRYLRGLGL